MYSKLESIPQYIAVNHTIKHKVRFNTLLELIDYKLYNTGRYDITLLDLDGYIISNSQIEQFLSTGKI